MEVKSGLKQTEIGMFPVEWEQQPLADLFTFQNGVNASKAAYGSGTQFINVLEVITHPAISEVRIPGRVNLPKQVVAAFAVQNGDVLFNRTSETQAEVGLASVYTGTTTVVFGGFVIRGKPKNCRLRPSFAAYALRTPAVRTQIVARGQGVVRANIGQRDLRRVQIVLPVVAEQELIAETLNDADALIESLEKLLVKKRSLKQGAMQELLTGKKRLPGFSGDWEVKVLGDVFSFGGGYSASRDQLSAEGYCYLHYGDIHTPDKTFIDVRSEYQDIPKLKVPLKSVSPVSLLDDGDVVFVDASEDDEGISKHVVIVNGDKKPFISGLHTIVAKCRAEVLEHQYRRYCFQTAAVKTQFRFFAVGTKVSGISKSNIAKITMPIPSVAEQSAISAILADMDAEIGVLDAKLSKVRQLKHGMMQELLTGRIRLR
jgi:type I restriction enzyme S subunit